jgi:hypothetical protein
MKFWYPKGERRNRVGILTDFYDEYVELIDRETGEFTIIHWTKVEYIN